MTTDPHLPAFLGGLTKAKPVAFVVRTLVPVDKAVTRWSGGRIHLVPTAVLPQLTLTTTGRRTGRPREVPLLYVRDGGGYVVVGSNFGQRAHPAWVLNLEHNPHAEIQLGTEQLPVVAVPLDDAERQRLWPRIVRVWPGYDSYVQWAGDRRIRLFRLMPQDGRTS
ncbi:nitroreductase family deazaflavin-dependent oxidoreductase [Flexivirga sp. ID2601S]|uniref:Nitroreductase family deazaflavin-dependent oxidoreductase n=1 Tax=Flexivirga aerilata TaxID=1656889 RepID=A0A849AF14_9MICO|nr:nitroreductase/quinone reductase family protein [Flexivirga aerilata]NNG37768.1 nitroreductase family deazaflavin-dependent oxidoreductase [Flexivirga aerilata]